MAELEHLPVRQAKSGDPKAWDVLFKRYQLPLYTYVFELVHDEQSSLDIVQETFIAAARNIGSLRDDAKFGGWMFGIAHQKCVQRWRKWSNRIEVPLDDAAAEADYHESPEDWVIRREKEEDFMKLLNQLPFPQRSVLLLFFIEDFSLNQIADITGTRVGTVKSRLHYGKRTLRTLLENRK